MRIRSTCGVLKTCFSTMLKEQAPSLWGNRWCLHNRITEGNGIWWKVRGGSLLFCKIQALLSWITTLEMVALVLLSQCWSNLVLSGGKKCCCGQTGIHRWDLISTWCLKNMFKISGDPYVYVGICVVALRLCPLLEPKKWDRSVCFCFLLLYLSCKKNKLFLIKMN